MLLSQDRHDNHTPLSFKPRLYQGLLALLLALLRRNDAEIMGCPQAHQPVMRFVREVGSQVNCRRGAHLCERPEERSRAKTGRGVVGVLPMSGEFAHQGTVQVRYAQATERRDILIVKERFFEGIKQGPGSALITKMG